MALTNIFPIAYPFLVPTSYTGTGAGTSLIDAANEGSGCVIYPTKTGDIHSISFYISTTSSPVLTLSVGVYAVDATTGMPDTSTAFGGMVAGTLENPTSGWKTVNLSTDCTISDLDVPVALVAFCSAYTSGSATIRQGSPSNGVQALSYLVAHTGAWAKVNGSIAFVPAYADGSISFIQGTAALASSVAVNTGTTPDEVGMKIILPFSCRIIGATFILGGTSARDLDVILYDSSSGVLKSKSLDGEIYSASAGGRLSPLFSSPYSGTLDETVRIAILPTTASSQTFQLIDNSLDASLTKQAYGPTLYEDMAYTSRSNEGAWTDDPTKQLMISLLIDQIDLGSQSGTSVQNYGFSWLGRR